MRYALLLYLDPVRASAATATEAQRELSTYAAITEDLARDGVLQGGEAFLPRAMSRFVGASDKRQTGRTDLELSGFYIVSGDEEQALEIAARMPVVTHGLVEVRPLMDLPEPTVSPDDVST